MTMFYDTIECYIYRIFYHRILYYRILQYHIDPSHTLTMSLDSRTPVQSNEKTEIEGIIQRSENNNNKLFIVSVSLRINL